MRFFFLTLSAIAAVASAASKANPFNIPTSGYSFQAGKPTTLTWNPTTEGTVTLRLQWGAVMTPDSGSLIASNIANSGSFTWTPPANLAAQPDYTVEILSDEDTSEVNYLPRFTVLGATGSATTSTAASTTTAATSSTEKSTSTEAKTTSSAESKTTMMTTTSSEASTTSSSKSHSTTEASTTADASSTTSAAASETTVPNTNAGMANRVSGGLLAVMLGAVAFL